ncbi:MAG: DUF58 domain-containing protein, partial [Paramuribaculum sp.]|nr:DUF58 domain-containing protein [Paramuribaculum sp.]
YIISQLLDFQPSSNGTDIPYALKFFTDALKKRCTTFLISDFIDEHDMYKSLSIASNKHDVISVQVYDKRDTSLPDIGLVKVTDMETGKSGWIDTSSKTVRKNYSKHWYDRQQRVTDTMMRCKIDMVSIATDEDYVKALMMLFKNRGVR